jgi:hypothetical protein
VVSSLPATLRAFFRLIGTATQFDLITHVGTLLWQRHLDQVAHRLYCISIQLSRCRIMPFKVDDFDPVSNGDLRELWRVCRDPALRRLILEVVRYRRVLDKAHAEALEIQYGLQADNRGKIVSAAQTLLARLQDEKIRLGSQGGNVIRLETDGQYTGERWGRGFRR